MIVTWEFGSYNHRRFSRPWIARVFLGDKGLQPEG